jgi:hypothetical protein
MFHVESVDQLPFRRDSVLPVQSQPRWYMPGRFGSAAMYHFGGSRQMAFAAFDLIQEDSL